MPPARLARTAFFPSMPAPAPIVLSFGICLYLHRHFPNFSLFYHTAVFTAQVPAVFAGLIVRHGKCVKIISSLKTAARRTYLHQTAVSFNIIVRRFMIQLILHILFLLCLRTAENPCLQNIFSFCYVPRKFSLICIWSANFAPLCPPCCNSGRTVCCCMLVQAFIRAT